MANKKDLFSSNDSQISLVEAKFAEQNLQFLVNSGDFEMLSANEAFLRRTVEGKIQLICKAIDNRISQLSANLNELNNLDKIGRSATMGVLQRIRILRGKKTQLLMKFYESGMKFLTSEAGEKIDF